MYYGAILDGINTLYKWGLVLLDDLEEGTPELKTNYQDVGGMDGQLNLSYALTGGPVFGMRPVSFTLCRLLQFPQRSVYAHPMSMSAIWSELMTRYHGREVELILPTDLLHHYTGVVQIGRITGKSRDCIPVSMTAEPWRERHEPTQITASLTQTPIAIELPNETRPVIPTITVTATTKITFSGADHFISPGTHRVLDIVLAPGKNIVQAAVTTDSSGQITLEYTKAVM